MRAFFSVDLPPSLADGVAKVQKSLADATGLDPVDPADAHVTLDFLGDVADDEYDAVIEAGREAVEAADVGPFEVAVGGLGVFPSLDYISVVWAGVEDGAAELARLHEALESRTTDLGFEPEDHAFTPHVTLARMRDARGKELVQKVVRETDPDVGRFEATELRLTASHLTDEGPEYETVERFEL
ncbi:RNA 2',3'-cyclic phosphodiesterase [Haloparvum sedimenti]|uniref:RNA 2',3'-cyclic phosphodiesterase n=1 Tax=Haloparvum sedimenti TaxID=1678448 RepID=UPI00071E8BC9|nr:RNA 2',3'-cyclic phosphodiesterase [Haloparvum sedimenti]